MPSPGPVLKARAFDSIVVGGLIATGAATTFFLASRALPVLLRRPVVSGLGGLGVWAFMYYLVLPTTFNRPNTLPAWPMLANQLGIHALGVGLPIALLASRSARSVRQP